MTEVADQFTEERSGEVTRISHWIDGQRVHWQEYVDSLQRTVDWCDEKLLDAEPFEVRSQGTT